MTHRLRRLIQIFVCGCILWVGASPALAQLKDSTPIDQWKYQVSVAGSILNGNVNRNLLISDAIAEYQNQDWGLYQRLNWQWGSFGNQLTENDWIARNFLYLWPQETWYPYLMTWFESNLRRQIPARLQIGPGLSWRFLDMEQHQLKVSTTLTIERSWFASLRFAERPDLNQSVLDTARATLRLAGQSHLIDSLSLNYELWLQPSLLDINNLRYYLEAGLNWKLNPQLAFKTSFLHTHESVRLSNVAANDFFVTFGLLFQSP